ncbi:hypothetical protein C8F01DRAFT_160578 [Mycena amicta]|nr:hypothetical protein C8F01DRAFT_160578 [Mycena amicta]
MILGRHYIRILADDQSRPAHREKLMGFLGGRTRTRVSSSDSPTRYVKSWATRDTRLALSLRSLYLLSPGPSSPPWNRMRVGSSKNKTRDDRRRARGGRGRGRDKRLVQKLDAETRPSVDSTGTRATVCSDKDIGRPAVRVWSSESRACTSIAVCPASVSFFTGAKAQLVASLGGNIRQRKLWSRSGLFFSLKAAGSVMLTEEREMSTEFASLSWRSGERVCRGRRSRDTCPMCPSGYRLASGCSTDQESYCGVVFVHLLPSSHTYSSPCFSFMDLGRRLQ